jgi:hypothetical protein
MSAIIASILPIALVAALIGYLGKDRKFGFWGNFFVSLILTPVIGLLVFFAQSPKAVAKTP